MNKNIIFITHADIFMDKNIPVPEWGLSQRGIERHHKFNEKALTKNIKMIYSSAEKKAKMGAEILSNHLGIGYHIAHDLHENDRSATSFLPPNEFQLVANEFFAKPDQSVRGWERATDAQTRIVACVSKIIDDNGEKSGDIAIISHGGVGTLLLCHLMNKSITRSHDQPQNGGGNYFIFNDNHCKEKNLIHGWKAIDG